VNLTRAQFHTIKVECECPEKCALFPTEPELETYGLTVALSAEHLMDDVDNRLGIRKKADMYLVPVSMVEGFFPSDMLCYLQHIVQNWETGDILFIFYQRDGREPYKHFFPKREGCAATRIGLNQFRECTEEDRAVPDWMREKGMLP
jgi:hypothetical protein